MSLLLFLTTPDVGAGRELEDCGLGLVATGGLTVTFGVLGFVLAATFYPLQVSLAHRPLVADSASCCAALYNSCLLCGTR